jgi:Domain of unknown function (DUF4169)
MADVVNLNQYRKQRARRVSQKRAAENRSRFGGSKQEQEKSRREAEKAAKDLDNKRLD